MPVKDVLSDQISSVEVSLPAYNLRNVLFGLDLRPINGFAAKPYVNAIRDGQIAFTARTAA